MRLLRQSLDRDTSGSMTLLPEDPEDMYFAYNLIRPGDLLRCTTIRKVTSESSTGSTSSHRERITLTISVTKLDFDTQASALHVSGRIVEETRFTRVGQFHTLDLELQREFRLEKRAEGGKEGGGAWDSVAVGMVREACDPVKKAECWALAMQDGVANIAVLTGMRTVFRQCVRVGVAKKDAKGGKFEKTQDKFFQMTLDTLLRQMDLSESMPILIAGPGYTAKHFREFIIETATRTGNKALLAQKSNIVVVHAASASLDALNETLQAPEVHAQLKDTKYARETKLMEDFMTSLRKDDGKAWYGPKEVEKAAEMGALGRGGGVLLISDELFRAQDVHVRRRWVKLVDKVRDVEGGEVRVLSSAHQSGQRLKSLGGVAGILTFPIYDLDEDEEDGVEESGAS